MSHFKCEECGTNILEGDNGQYITGCIHYPMNTILTDKECQELRTYRYIPDSFNTMLRAAATIGYMRAMDCFKDFVKEKEKCRTSK